MLQHHHQQHQCCLAAWLTVLALPNASRMGLLSRTRFSTDGRVDADPPLAAEETVTMSSLHSHTPQQQHQPAADAAATSTRVQAAHGDCCDRCPRHTHPTPLPLGRPTVAKYCMMILVVSVLPAPDSPDTSIDWLRLSTVRRASASTMHRYALPATA